MTKIKLTLNNSYKLRSAYEAELDDHYIKYPDKPGYLFPNSEAKRVCFYVAFDDIRVTDYMTKQEANDMVVSLRIKSLYGLELEPKEPGYVDTSLLIVACEIKKGNYQNDVMVTNVNGDTYKAFSYYPDELHFYSGEFIGKTGDQAVELFHKKDVAYLRS